ncbi:hypothetical protein AXG93_374s1150 [Marchantia polymorpha subsp. ruderalis]|nr:hypothetical protein AXG93_374s1150 [Marchantia polymorpha subsp. ruderalis]
MLRLPRVSPSLPQITHIRRHLRSPLAFACEPASSTTRAFAAKAAPDMEGKEAQQPGAERKAFREDMEDSYGEAYATRSSDEGYGEAYGEAVKRYQTNPDIKEVQRGATSERDQKADAFADTKSGSDYDTSQGHPVAEKEKARHAKHEDAFEHEKTEEATGAST